MGAVLVLLTLATTGAARPADGVVPLAVGGISVADDLSLARVAVYGGTGVVALGPSGPLEVRDGQLLVPLAFADSPEPQQVVVHLSRGDQAGDVSILYWGHAYYARIKAALNGVVLLDTTLPRFGSASLGPGMQDSVVAVDTDSPNGEQWKVARASGLAPGVNQNVETAVLALFRQLDSINDPGIGPLCSEVASGIETLNALASGACWVWCTGNARILRGFLRSAGVPARLVALDPRRSYLPNGVLVESSEGHATAEWWDGNRWVFIGPTTRTLRATGLDGASLSVKGLIDALADPITRDGILFTRLDPATDAWRTLPYGAQDAAFKLSIQRDFTADKVLVGVDRSATPFPGRFATAVRVLLLGSCALVAVAIVSLLGRRRVRARMAPSTT